MLDQDVEKLADCERIVQEAIDGLGGLDVIVSNAVGSEFTLLGLMTRRNTSIAISWPRLMYL